MSKQLGHHKVTTTEDFSSHLIEENKEKVSACIADTLLSINLGIMNLLPFPALDGGRLVLLIIEAIRGKKLNPRYEGYITMAGAMMLIALMIFVLFNDITKFF